MSVAEHVEARKTEAAGDAGPAGVPGQPSRTQRMIHILGAALVAAVLPVVLPVVLLYLLLGELGSVAVVIGLLLGVVGSKLGTRRMLYLAPAVGVAGGLGAITAYHWSCVVLLAVVAVIAGAGMRFGWLPPLLMLACAATLPVATSSAKNAAVYCAIAAIATLYGIVLAHRFQAPGLVEGQRVSLPAAAVVAIVFGVALGGAAAIGMALGWTEPYWVPEPILILILYMLIGKRERIRKKAIGTALGAIAVVPVASAALPAWTWALNTPFKLWKGYSNFEGGTANPMIVPWPARTTSTGLRRQYVHAVDIVPTLYSLQGIAPPEVVKGYTQFPLEGISFDVTLNDLAATTDKQTQFYSMGGTRAIWHQGWKAAATSPAAPDAWAHYATQGWGLFNTDDDPTECHDLAAQEPEKLQELIQLWWAQAGQYGVLPLENRNSIEVLTTDRPQHTRPRNRYVYYPGCAEVPESVAPNICIRSDTVAVGVTIDAEDASGVLFAHGARFGGHALYVKDGKLKCVHNFVGDTEQIVESTEPLLTGHVIVSASFERVGDAVPAEGAPSASIWAVARSGGTASRPQPGRSSIAGQGLNIGKDGAEPVTGDYPNKCANTPRQASLSRYPAATKRLTSPLVSRSSKGAPGPPRRTPMRSWAAARTAPAARSCSRAPSRWTTTSPSAGPTRTPGTC